MTKLPTARTNQGNTLPPAGMAQSASIQSDALIRQRLMESKQYLNELGMHLDKAKRRYNWISSRLDEIDNLLAPPVEPVRVNIASRRDTLRAVLQSSVQFTLAASARRDILRANVTLSSAAVAPAITTQATISGNGVVGQTLTVNIGAASGSPAPTSAIQWRRGASNISGATGATYVLVSADAGQTITARVTWANASGNAVSSPSIVVSSSTVVIPAGYTRIDDFVIDKDRSPDFSGHDLYLPVWQVGHKSVGEPDLITWNADKSATLKAERRAPWSTDPARSWFTGTMQGHRDLRHSQGRFGTLVHVTRPNAVAAFFGYANNSKEIDFELTFRNGTAGWSPAVHMPAASGSGRRSSSNRTMTRGPLTNAPQLLEYDLRADRCDFYCDGVLFETIRPADMAAGYVWDTTTNMAPFWSVEEHESWAGWVASDYAKGAEMIVYASTPTATVGSVSVAPSVTAQATINGSGVVGNTLTVSIGAASGTPAPASAIQWRRGSTNISGATGTSYTLVSADANQTVTARVTWTNSEGSAISSPSIAVTDVATPGTGLTNPSIGFNFGGVSDWLSANPFADVGKTKRPFQGHSDRYSWSPVGTTIPVDANGWPTSLPSGVQKVVSLMFTDQPSDPLKAGTHRVRWTVRPGQQPNFRIGSTDVTSGTETTINISASGGIGLDLFNAAVNSMSIVHTRDVPTFDNGDMFNQAYIDKIKDFRTVRFMNWQEINGPGNAGNPIVNWSQRKSPTYHTWAGWEGVPIEVMVALANRIGADPYFCMPHLASDDYMTQFATYVRDNLDPRLKARVELGNEIWNLGTFGAGQHFVNLAAQLWPGQNFKWMQAYAIRAVDMAKIWANVFSGQRTRLKTVLSSQTGWDDLMWQAMDAPLWTNPDGNKRPHEYFDEFAVTAYLGYGLGSDDYAQELLNIRSASGEAAALTRAFQILTSEANSVASRYTTMNGWITSRGMDMVMYEGGSHASGVLGWVNNATLVDLLRKVNRDARMGTIYTTLLNGWRTAGGKAFCLFTDIERATKDGTWGHLESLSDSTPRWDAVMAWNAANPGWYETRATGTFLGTV